MYFLINISDLIDNITSDAKLFDDDTLLFTVMYDKKAAAHQLNCDLKVINLIKPTSGKYSLILVKSDFLNLSNL